MNTGSEGPKSDFAACFTFLDPREVPFLLVPHDDVDHVRMVEEPMRVPFFISLKDRGMMSVVKWAPSDEAVHWQVREGTCWEINARCIEIIRDARARGT